MKTQPIRKAITTFDLWRMPEFKAFCEAAGIEYYIPIPGSNDRPGNGMVIEIPFDLNGLVTVTQTYMCRPGFRDATKAAAEAKKTCKMPSGESAPYTVVENTTPHNEHYRTHQQGN